MYAGSALLQEVVAAQVALVGPGGVKVGVGQGRGGVGVQIVAGVQGK